MVERRKNVLKITGHQGSGGKRLAEVIFGHVGVRWCRVLEYCLDRAESSELEERETRE